ncbi:MAG: nicotinamide riboside transporter PnuC [Bacteroidetes bacterium]|nr:MAG: nicotinamide riboside transporter PnuC [Bacteroidota bacterium]
MGSWIDFFFEPYYSYSTLDIWLEALAVLFGLASVWYAKREHIWVYPTGLISTGIYVYICLMAGLYGDMGINGYYFAMSIYGWYRWTRPGEGAPILPITRLRGREAMLSLGLLLAFFGVLAWVLTSYTDSTVPLIDAFTTSIFFVGMLEMARKKLEHWIYWIIGDIISVPLYFYKGLTLTSFQYLVFLGIAIAGYISWRKSLSVER